MTLYSKEKQKKERKNPLSRERWRQRVEGMPRIPDVFRDFSWEIPKPNLNNHP